MQRMIRQFASEYTSKSSSSQDFLQPNARKDQSLSKALPRELAGPVPTVSAQNPVLSKMLMAEQDFPLDLTIKKPEVEPCEQDGVLDLSIKKSRSTGSLSHRNSQGYPATAKKGVSLERNLAKVQDMQSTSTLEQFMAKLCLHHQRQIVNALGFLQSEVKAVGSSCCAGSSASKATLEGASERDCSPVTWQENADIPSGHTAAAVSTCSARSVSQSLEMANLENGNSSLIQQLTPVHAGYTDTSCESCTSLTLANPVDLCKATSGNSQGPSFQFSSSKESESLRPDELLLARKNTSSGSLADMDKFQLFDGSCHTSGTLDERQCNPETLLYPVRDETNLEELSLSIGSHGQLFDHPYHTEQRASSGITKDLLACSFPIKKATKTISPSSPRTARKSSRGTYPRPRHSVCQINDPDSHCDIVYISKPITECELQPPNHIFPRRNARKSTRGYAYMEEVRELKTVRTLAGKPGTNANKGNCPALGLETSTSLTPKQALSKPESVPPVDIPFAGGCVETVGQNATLEQHIEKSMAECEVAAGREAELIVETSQTDQPPFKDQNQFPSVLSTSENQQSTVMETEAVQQNSVAEDIVTGHDDPTELLVTQTLLPQDNLPGHNVGTGDKIASEDETENCSGDVQVLQADLRSASPILAAEEPISSESIGASSDLSKQDQVPEPPVAEDQELPVHAEKETLMQIEEHVEKENIEELQNTITEPVSSTTGSIIPEESRTDDVGEIVEKEVMKELSMEMKQLMPTKDEVGEKEVVVTPSETVSPKRSSSRDIAPSDRCLRRRPQPVSSEPIKAIKTSLVTPNPIQIQDSPVDSLKMSGSVRPQRSVRAKQHATLNLSDSILQRSDETTIDKTLLSSEVRPNANQEVDNMVQTRHKSMLAKQLENEERGQGFKPSSAATAGPSTEVVGQKISDQVAHLKEKPAKSASESNIPENSSVNVENTSEIRNKMPLTRERSKSDRFPKPMKSATLMKHKKLVLRSQRSAALAASSPKVENEQIQASPDTKFRTEKSLPSRTQKKDLDPFGLQKLNISLPNPPKFLEALRGEENQPQIMSLNTKFEKMQRGWVQLDKEGQPIQRPKNRADRLKEIWKSKRRVRKPKPLDQQKYSPVQMLFMKTFDLTSICHWFLQTTETKSLVIVKKVNTRLPSETALCFHSSSASSGSGNGVFSSLQAERLKKHLKKFAVASPVKSNAKNQKLIAKALEQEFPCSKGKDKVRELTSATRISTKPYNNPRKLEVQAPEPRKAASTIKSPASARILRKYTSIREKLHVQQHALKPKEIVREDVESSCSTPLLAPKLISKPKALPEHGRKTVPAGDNGVKELHSGKTLKVNSPSSKKDSLKKVVKEKATKPNSRETLQTACKKGHKAPKRSPPASLAASKPRKPASSALSGLEHRAGVPCRASNILSERKDGIVKSALPEARNPKLNMKSALRSKVLGSETVQPQKPDMLPSPTQDQVLTRSQRKMEAVPSKGAVLRPSLKRSQEPLPTPTKRTRTLVLK